MISSTTFRRLLATALCCACSTWLAVPLAAQTGKRLEIVAASTPVKTNATQLGLARQGEKYDLLEQSGSWYRISFQGKTGWVAAADARIAAAIEIPAAVPTHAVVVVDEATVALGTTKLATVRRGQVLPIVSQSAPWIKVLARGNEAMVEGYLRDNQLRLLEVATSGPSLAGLSPASITTASVSVDWKTEQVTVTATIPRSGDVSLSLVPPPDADRALPLPEIVQTGDQVVLRGSTSDLLRVLSPGTRSFWLTEDSEVFAADDAAEDAASLPLRGPTGHRVDLPTPQPVLEVGTYDFPTFTEGLILTLPVRNLLPGYVLEIAESTGAPFGPMAPIAREKGTLPRVTDVVTPAQGPPMIRIAVPRNSDAKRSWYRIAVRNPDGSRSAYLALGRSGRQFDKAASVSAPAAELPVDSTIPAPPVELLSAEEATARAKAAGLSPKYVEDGTYVEVKQPPADAIVIGQGLEPGTRALTGQSLVLALENASPDANLNLLSRGGLVDDSLLADTTAIDTADDLNFIDISQTGLVGEIESVDANDSGLVIDDSSLDSQLIEGGGLVGNLGDDLVIDGNQPGEIVQGGSTILGIDTDPGVNINPVPDADQQFLAAILKLLLEAILRQPNPQDLPGTVGSSISQAIQECERKLLSALLKPYEESAAEQAPAEILNLVVNHLGLDVDEAAKASAVSAWRAYAERRWNPLRIDRNTNARVADDVAIWFVVWLFEHGHFNPATAVTLASGADGNPVAVVPSKPQSLDWLAELLKLIKLPLFTPQQPNLVIPPAVAGDKPPPAETKKKKLPEGKPVVTTSSVPDEVRVPETEDQLVDSATRRLNEIGLRVSDARSLFDSDKVVDSTPAADTWQPTGTAVELEVHRRVPNVTRLQLTDAEARLRQWRLRWTTDTETFKGDVVTAQEPRAGTYIPLNEPIDLELSAVVPHVVGMLQRDAASALSEVSLGWSADTKAFVVDRVVSQDPPAGTLVLHGEKVAVVLHLPVPAVTGTSLERAREILAKWDLLPDVPNGSAHESDTVRDQQPQAGTYVPHASELRLDPIVAIVPDVRGMDVDSATRRLRDDEDFSVSLYGDLIGDDIVTMQNPSGGTELERGRRITLDARVQVPNVYRRPVLEARDTINSADGNLRADIVADLARTDVVYAQSPRGGEWVFPRTTVTLVPGVYVPQLNGMSPAQADDALRSVSLNGRIVSSGTRPTTDRSLIGSVLIEGQSPNPGLYDRRTVGEVQLSAVRIIADLRTVPFVREMRVSEAVAAIRRAGLRVEISDEGSTLTPEAWAAKELIRIALLGVGASDYIEPPIVDQDPRGGQEVFAGSTVTIIPFRRVSR